MFGPMTSIVSTFSGFVANSHQALRHVSSSPSKIPYVGFSPVRLQTGIQMRPSLRNTRFKCEAHMHPVSSTLYAPKAVPLCFCGPFGHVWRNRIPTAIQSRGPWLSGALCCHTRSSLTMASSEPVCPFQCLIFFVHWIFALRPRMGWYRQIPQFAPRICDTVPSSVPRRPCQVHMVASSLTVLAFAVSAMARQPRPTHAGSHVGSVTRLQSSLYATARCLASSSPARTFTIELSPDGSPQSDVDYNYTANNQLPQPDLHRQDTRPYGLRTEYAEKNQKTL